LPSGGTRRHPHKEAVVQGSAPLFSCSAQAPRLGVYLGIPQCERLHASTPTPQDPVHPGVSGSSKLALSSLSHGRHQVVESVKVSGTGAHYTKKDPAVNHNHGWQEVRHKVWRKKTVDQPLQTRHSIHGCLQFPATVGKRAREETTQRSQPQWGQIFKQHTVGHCFHCLGFDHRVADCCDSLKCFRCFRFGHRAQNCSPSTTCVTIATPQSSTNYPSTIASTMLPNRLAMPDLNRSGSPSKQTERVTACVTISPYMLAMDNAYHVRNLIAITISDDLWLHLTQDAV
jgi:hypothetical protein